MFSDTGMHDGDLMITRYWTPKLYFQDPTNGSFTDVPLFYMNVYYL